MGCKAMTIQDFFFAMAKIAADDTLYFDRRKDALFTIAQYGEDYYHAWDYFERHITLTDARNSLDILSPNHEFTGLSYDELTLHDIEIRVLLLETVERINKNNR